MAEHGGYREPQHPAAVSGPGALSRRTDGGPSDTQPARIAPGNDYGDRKAMLELQRSAPMEGGQAPAPPPPGLLDKTARADEPVTNGADAGPGLGMIEAGIGLHDASLSDLAPYVRSLEMIANLPGSNPATLTFVRALKASLGMP